MELTQELKVNSGGIAESIIDYINAETSEEKANIMKAAYLKESESLRRWQAGIYN